MSVNNMSTASCLLSEEELLCSVCLEVLTDPVSTPCGHNFCKECISENWRVNTPCRCPFCNEVFSSRPQLKTNVFISAMVAQYRQRAAHNVSQDQCLQHHKPLELFCESDQRCVCVLCSLQHQGHELVPLKNARETTQRELQKSQEHTQKMILDRTQKIRHIQQSLELSQTAAEEEAAEGVHFFSALMEMVQKALDELLQEIQEKQKKVKTQAEALILSLELEISELEHRSIELEQLSRSKDHVHVLKTFSSLTAAPLKDWTNIRLKAPLFVGTFQKAVIMTKKQMLTVYPKPLSKSQLMELQQYAVEVTLDPETAHPELALSADLRQVSHFGQKRKVPKSSGRITGYHGVLGKQSFSLGRHYFQVQVSKCTNWVLGLAKEFINRRDHINATTTNGFWTVHLTNEKYYTADPEPSLLHVQSVVQTVGVFLDYDQGQVSFYDVDKAALLYSYTDCRFTERLYPYFYTNSRNNESFEPLIIAPVKSRS